MQPRRFSSLICFFVLCVGLCSFAGCDSTPAERITAVRNLLSQVSIVNQTVDAGIADFEKVIADSQAMLNDPNIPPDMRLEVEQVFAKATTRLAKLKAEKQKVSALIERYQSLIDSVDVNNLTSEQELQLYATGAGEAAQLLPPQYRGYVFLGLALVPLLGSILKNVNQWRQINDGKKRTTELVISVDELLGSAQIMNANDAKIILQKNQSGATQELVDAIHDPMKNTAPAK